MKTYDLDQNKVVEENQPDSNVIFLEEIKRINENLKMLYDLFSQNLENSESLNRTSHYLGAKMNSYSGYKVSNFHQ